MKYRKERLTLQAASSWSEEVAEITPGNQGAQGTCGVLLFLDLALAFFFLLKFKGSGRK